MEEIEDILHRAKSKRELDCFSLPALLKRNLACVQLGLWRNCMQNMYYPHSQIGLQKNVRSKHKLSTLPGYSTRLREKGTILNPLSHRTSAKCSP